MWKQDAECVKPGGPGIGVKRSPVCRILCPKSGDTCAYIRNFPVKLGATYSHLAWPYPDLLACGLLAPDPW